jgi:hypothetical protein
LKTNLAVREDDLTLTNQKGRHPGSLPPKQERALQALISHPTLKEAAFAAGISETTLWRYMKDEAFSRRLLETRGEAISYTVTLLQRGSVEAVTVLRSLMANEDTPPSVRASAARTFLEYALHTAEVDALRARLDQLEEYLKAKEEEDKITAAKEDQAERIHGALTEEEG